MKRRSFLAGMGAAALLPRAARGRAPQLRALDELLQSVTRGAPAREGRVTLDLPVLADSGNSVTMKVRVESQMSAADHVRSIRLLSQRNPVRDIATFRLGPRAGRAEVVSRLRLAGSQSILAVAEMSDGSFWYHAVPVIVTLSACVDES